MYEKAIELSKKALDLNNPNSTEVLFLYAIALINNHETMEGLQQIKKVIDMHPSKYDKSSYNREYH